MPILRCFLTAAPRILVTFALLCVTASAAHGQPQFYETTLRLQEPVVNISFVDRVVYRWSTFQSSGMVEESGLEDFTMLLYAPSGLVYADHVIIDGVVQPYAGLSRSLADTFWRFDLDASSIEQMANTSVELIEASADLQFHVYDSTSIPDDGRVSVKAYVDGINQDPHTDQLGSQTTVAMLFFSDFETGDLSDWSAAVP